MIEINNLKIGFGENRVLDGVNLKIEAGKTTVVMGMSGSGKSVLLKIIVGILFPDSGSVKIKDEEIIGAPVESLNRIRKKIGFLFQGAALYDSLTVGENLGLCLSEHLKQSESQISKKVREALSMVGMAGIEEKMPADLSGGMKKRVGLARAIIMEPEIILYDEPTTGLDPVRADSINQLIVKMKDKLHITSVVVTHDMKSAFNVADSMALLYDGKIIESGVPDKFRSPKNEYVRQFIEGSSVGPIK